jgi:S1-C subfamily serine protease
MRKLKDTSGAAAIALCAWIAVLSGCAPQEAGQSAGSGRRPKEGKPTNVVPMSDYLIPDGERYRRIRAGCSYRHDVYGKLLPAGSSEQPRNVFRTHFGAVLAIVLNSGAVGHERDWIDVVNITDPETDIAARSKIDFRGTWTVSFATPVDPKQSSSGRMTVEIRITGSFEGTYIDVTAWDNMHPQRETARVSLDDLYGWRTQRILASKGGKTLELNGKAFIQDVFKIPEFADAIEVRCLFAVEDLESGRSRVGPRYAWTEFVQANQGFGERRRVADRIVVGTSGYHVVWDPKAEQWFLEQHDEVTVQGADPLAREYEARKSAVVKISHAGGSGTGFLVDNGLVLTNRHVVKGVQVGNAVTLTFMDHLGRRKDVPGIVLPTATSEQLKRYDLALVRPNAPIPVYTKLEFATAPAKVGEPVFTVGHPGIIEWKLDWSFVAHRIAGYREEGGIRFVQLDGSVNRGNSGGPLITSSGLVVGVIYAFGNRDVVESIGLAVPGDIARAFVKDVLERQPPAPVLGLPRP